MAGKMSTIVMMVDLECDRCYRKIRRVLCKLQDKASIKAISYDEKNNTVTVAGPFDADEVSDRLCSSAGKVITDIRVVGGAKPMPGGGGGGAKAHANKPAGKDGSAGGGGGGGGGKPEMIKKHVKFEMADDMDDGRHHHHHDNRKPKVVTTTNHAAGALARMEGRRAEAPSMAIGAGAAGVGAQRPDVRGGVGPAAGRRLLRRRRRAHVLRAAAAAAGVRVRRPEPVPAAVLRRGAGRLQRHVT